MWHVRWLGMQAAQAPNMLKRRIGADGAEYLVTEQYCSIMGLGGKSDQPGHAVAKLTEARARREERRCEKEDVQWSAGARCAVRVGRDAAGVGKVGLGGREVGRL